MDTEQVKKDFCNYLKLRGYAKDYAYSVNKWLSFCSKNNIDFLNTSIRDYTNFLVENRQIYSSGYIDNLVKALRFFYAFLPEYNYQPSSDSVNDTKKLKLGKPEKKLRYSLTYEEIEKLLDRAVRYDFMNPYRLRAIVWFIFYTGLRPSELVKISREDVFPDQNMAIVRTPNKSKKERVVLFPNRMSKMLVDYYNNDHQTVINLFNLTRNKLIYIFKFLQNFNKKLTPRVLRHSFGHHLKRMGVDPETARELFGHSDLETTMIYFQSTPEEKKEIYLKRIR